MTDYFKKLVLDHINRNVIQFPTELEEVCVKDGKFKQQIVGGDEEISGNKIFLI